MLPVFALVGRPNVGKSTLFNCLTRSRDALVFDTPGITRDRLYGQGRYIKEDGEHPYIVIDTGGISTDDSDMDKLMQQQAWQATKEAQVVVWLVDAQDGLMPADIQLAQRLRELNKPVILVVNKMDGKAPAVACSEFYQLGWDNIVPITASHNQGIGTLLDAAFDALPELPPVETGPQEDAGIQVAVIGRPNVGKSTLINRLLGEERVVVYDAPGTTRDSIFIPFTRREQKYTLIDTAGVRRKQKISDVLEKFSVVKTLQAIATAHVVIFLFDAHEGVTDQDLSLVQFVLEAGRGLIVAINKWDGLDTYQRQQMLKQVDRRL
jgi:GTP-binding protein